jgi:hypothetical protein
LLCATGKSVAIFVALVNKELVEASGVVWKKDWRLRGHTAVADRSGAAWGTGADGGATIERGQLAATEVLGR